MKARKQYNYISLGGFESSNMGPFIYKIKYNELVESELSLSSRFDKTIKSFCVYIIKKTLLDSLNIKSICQSSVSVWLQNWKVRNFL
jgi:hypothetical protein